LRALRWTSGGGRVYFIAVGDPAGAAAVQEALGAGADDYLERPLTPAALVARLYVARRVIRQQQEREMDLGDLQRYAAELAEANQRLHEAALTDSLTGLHNRRAAMEHLGREWEAATRSARPLGCLVLDIDHFKRVNDAHGHEAGDAVLQEVATLLRSVARRSDIVCRMGGEEFCVLCPNTGLEEAQRYAERLRERVQAATFEAGGAGLSVTISVGVAVRDARMHYPADLLRAADAAVYAAKRAGRNRVGLTMPLENARRAPRVPVGTGCKLRVEVSVGGATWPARAIDLSIVGVLLEFPAGDPGLSQGDRVTVQLRMGSVLVSLEASVARRQKRRYGLNFEFPDAEGPTPNLAALVAALEREWISRTMR
jgi:diguanylate cyclase (GGDEF)-like protein